MALRKCARCGHGDVVAVVRYGTTVRVIEEVCERHAVDLEAQADVTVTRFTAERLAQIR